jgi:hypothetical protein
MDSYAEKPTPKRSPDITARGGGVKPLARC